MTVYNVMKNSTIVYTTTNINTAKRKVHLSNLWETKCKREPIFWLSTYNGPTYQEIMRKGV